MYIPKRIPRGSHLDFWVEKMACDLHIAKQAFLKEAGIDQSTLDQNIHNIFPADKTLWLDLTDVYLRLRDRNRLLQQH